VVWLVADCVALSYQITRSYKRVVTLQIQIKQQLTIPRVIASFYFIMGLHKGQCNNRNGRPKNSINKNKALVSSFLDHLVECGFSRFTEELNKLNGKDYIKVFLSIAKIMAHDKSHVKANEKLIELFNQKIKENGINK